MVFRRALLLMLLACLTFVGQARAQASEEPEQHAQNDADLLWSPVTRREIQYYATLLHLEKDQLQQLLELYQGYRTQVRALVPIADARAAAQVKQLRPGEPKSPGRSRARFDAAYFLLDETERLTTTLFADAAALLKESQLPFLPAAARARRRHVNQRLCISSVERVDFIRMARDLGLEHTPELDEALLNYELRIDRLMVEKHSRVRRLFEELADAEIQGNEDPSTLGRVISELTRGSLSIRDMIRHHARLIEMTLPEADQKRWRREFNRRGYPGVYDHDATLSARAALLKNFDLTPEQRAQIEELAVRYQREAEQLAPAYIAALDSWHDLMARNDAMKVLSQVDKTDENDGLGKARRARERLARDCVSRMLATLTPEQRAKSVDLPGAEGVNPGADLFPILEGHEDHRREWDQTED
ncbi:MAG: Spy/CpxP family protein refolding chaperone [Planctomycetota bacterium]|nr:Spy/CpxP family protein refolding chaperone [Planctomycetota bacterium]